MHVGKKVAQQVGTVLKTNGAPYEYQTGAMLTLMHRVAKRHGCWERRSSE
jgi:hypothetical protein